MFTMKKLAGVIAAVAISATASAAVDPTASVVWSGMVPGSTVGTDLMITGLAGGSIGNGTLVVATDGTFTSSTVILESHENTGTLLAPVVGDITTANWTLSSALINYTTSSATGTTLVVSSDGATWAVGSQMAATDTLRLNVAQTADVDTTTGELVQVQVTVVASPIV